MIGFNRVLAKDLIGQVDNSSYPAISVKIHMTLVTPENATGPVPVLVMFGAPASLPPRNLRTRIWAASTQLGRRFWCSRTPR